MKRARALDPPAPTLRPRTPHPHALALALVVARILTLTLAPAHALALAGTPFIDNYPTFAFIRSGREDSIPSLIDRSFYAYASEALDTPTFEARFAAFQGANSDVRVEYVPSEFLTVCADQPRGARGS